MNELYDRLAPVVNGADYGDIGAGMHARLTNPAFMALYKPYIAEGGPNDGKVCVTANVRDPKTGKWDYTNNKGEKVPYRVQMTAVEAKFKHGLPVPDFVFNATVFRRDNWIAYQDEAELAYRENLKFVSTLQQNVQVTVPGWGKLSYEYDAMSDAHSAVQDMDGMTEGAGDMPQWLPRSVPLPFTHSDYHYSDRIMAASRSDGGTGIDVYSAEMAGRRVAELMEDVSTGMQTGVTWGTRANYFPHDLTSTVFGALNYTNRNTKTNFTAPTAGGWVPDTTYNEILAALQTLLLDRVSGRVAIFYSIDFEQYMHRVYSLAGGNTPGETLRTMLLKHERVASVELLERLTNVFTLIIVALDRRYVVFINGMDVRTWQWPTRGGMQQNFKTGVVQATLFKSDFTGRAGLLIGTTT